MKFIKDIIGEKRERVRTEAAVLPDATPVQPPKRDPFDSLAAAPQAATEPEQSAAPFSLDPGFQLDPDPETATGKYTLPEDFLDEDLSEDAPGSAPQDSPEDFLDSQDRPAPEEDTIAAFFAREQETALEPTAAAPDAAPKVSGPERQAAEDAAAEPFAEDADFSRLRQQPDATPSETHRVFHRKPATAAQPEPAPAKAPPVRQPDPRPEPAPQPLAEAQPAPEAPQIQAPAPSPAPSAAPKPVPQPAAAQAATADPAPIDVPAPSMGRGASRGGRVKTRLLGFSPAQAPGGDPFSRSAEGSAPGYTQFPVGWLAVVQGPGRGAAFTLFNGVSVIGRGEDQTVRIDFGDNSISRDNHAAIAYDPEQKAFYIGHGGKANLVRRNGRPVLSTEELSAGDEIRIGETTLRFVPLCGAGFGWDEPQQDESAHAALR
ncbi:FHA domain-containing protein [Leisingera sp. S232]|uniref:FHA domain-containing protein n=1 Tax=Leisingera sp. S232 TaxID=3415132 RepID=UPI000869C771|nr:hypothetical protein AB838_00940 [Rhodobacteraceae bacterium (ex Bugula neritina AB1)]